MQLGISADVAAAHNLIEDIGDRLEQRTTLLGILRDATHTYERELFETSGFGTWAPLSPSTVATKGNTRILVDTGGLLEALTSNAAFETDAIRVGTSRRGASYLKAGARGMPRRDPAPEPEQHVIRGWAEELLAFLVHGRRR